MNALLRTCRDVTRLLLERQNRPLGRLERVAVWLHLGICDMCTRFYGQLDLMNHAMTRWKAYSEHDEGPGD